MIQIWQLLLRFLSSLSSGVGLASVLTVLLGRRLSLRGISLLGLAALALAGPSVLRAQGLPSVIQNYVMPGPPTYIDTITAEVIVRDYNSGNAIREAGNVTTSVDGGPVQTTAVVGGVAYVNVGRLSIGSHSITFTFTGSASYASSTVTQPLPVVDAAFSYVGTQGTTLFVDGLLFSNQGIAVDPTDNVYESDSSENNVRKEDVFGTLSVLPFTGLSGPTGIAIDSASNVYLSDTGNNRILELTPAGVQSVVPVAGLTNATQIAYDRNNNFLYIADPVNGRVVQFNPSTGTQANVITGLTALRGVGVTAQGFVLVSDRYAGFLSIDSQGDKTPIFASVTEPGFITAGPDGSVIVTDNSNGAVLMIDDFGSQTQIGVGMVYSMATDSTGRTYLALGGRVDVLAPGSGRVPDEVVGDNSRYNAYEGVMFRTPQAAAAITFGQGPAGTFDEFETVTCGQLGFCVGSVQFTPHVAGYNLGNLSFTQGTVSGSVQLSGNGVGPQPAFTPGTPSQVSSGISTMGGVALDASGNRYVTDTTNATVSMITPADVATKVAFTGLVMPTQVAVDTLGGVYVLDQGSVLHLDSAGNQTVAYAPSEGNVYATAFALDGDTNFIVAGQFGAGADARPGKKPRRASLRGKVKRNDDQGTFSVIRIGREDIPPTQYQPEADTTFTESLVGPVTGVAIDPEGYAYALESTGNVWRFGPDGSTTQLASGLSNPVAIVVDAAQDVYVALGSSAQITVLSAGGTQSTLAVNGLSNPEAIASDAYGDLLIGDGGDKQLVFVDRTQQNYAFGNVAVSSSATLPGSITNIGNRTFSAPSLPSGPPFVPVVSSTECTSSGPQLTPGTSCDAGYTFTPLSAGPFTATAALGGFAPTSPGMGAMQFSGAGTAATAPTATLTPASFDYGTVNVGASGSQTFTLANTGTTAINIAAVSVPNTVFALATNSCGTTLAGGASCTYVVTFNPTAAGAQTTTLTVTDDAGTQTAMLTGTGAQPAAPQAALTPSTANFGSIVVGASSGAQSFTLTNAGNAALSITSVGLGGANAGSFKIASNTCGASLAASATCMLSVVYSPSAVGAATAMLSVVDAVGTQSSSLSGSATAPPAPMAALSPGTASFGEVSIGTTSSAQTFTLANAGNAALAITSVGVTGTNASAFVVSANGCGSALAAGASCTMMVTFDPSSAGAASATLAVADGVGTQTAALTGTGVAPPDFQIGATPSSQESYRGTGVKYAVQLTSADPANPFTNMVTLSATGLPSGASVSFSPAQVVPGTTAATQSTMTVAIPALTASRDTERTQIPGKLPAGVLLSSVAMAWMVRRKNKRQLPRLLLLGLLCLAGATATLAGCGSNGTGFATPTSTTTITVTGTSGTTTHSTTVSLTIK